MTNASHTEHTSAKSALTTSGLHFAKAGGIFHAFTNEDACWRFIQARREYADAQYVTRRELAAA